MKFMKQAEESTQQKFWPTHVIFPFTDPKLSYLCEQVVNPITVFYSNIFFPYN